MDTLNKAGGYLVKNLPKSDVGEFAPAEDTKKSKKGKDEDDKKEEEGKEADDQQDQLDEGQLTLDSEEIGKYCKNL